MVPHITDEESQSTSLGLPVEEALDARADARLSEGGVSARRTDARLRSPSPSPLVRQDSTGKDRPFKLPFTSAIRSLWKMRESRNLFLFVCINGAFMVVEGAYGLWSNSVGLLSDAFHMAFDCLALVVSLAALLISRRPVSKLYSYGYERFEIIAGFINGVLLLLISLVLLYESFRRIFWPPVIRSEQLITVSVLGLIVNLVGIAFFHEHATLHSASHGLGQSLHAHGHGAAGGHGHSHGLVSGGNENLHSVYLHILSDTLGSVGVIVSSYLVRRYNLYIADPIMSMIMSAIIIRTSYPLVMDTARTLMQSVPVQLRSVLDKCLLEAASFPGVLECCNERFWCQSPARVIGSLTVRVRSDVDEQRVLEHVQDTFRSFVQDLTVQIDKYDW